jgi:hypothetical protein
MTVTAHLHSVSSAPDKPEKPPAVAGSLHDLIRACQEPGMPRYEKALADYQESVRRIVIEHCFSADRALGAVLLRERRRFGRPRFSIALVYGSEGVDTGVAELFRRIQFEEEQSAVQLSRRAHQIYVRSLFGLISTLLSALVVADAGEAHSNRVVVTVESVSRELDRLATFVQSSARRTALGLYLAGLPIGALLGGVLVLLAGESLTIDNYIPNNLLPICLASGAIGAVISVMARVSRGEALDVDSDKGNVVTLLAGSFRAIIGAVLGAVLCVLIRGGILPLDVPDPEETSCLFFAGLAFLAGFTERWAQDTIVSSAPKVS